MAREQPFELFMPPNILKAKVGGNSFNGLDMAAIQRAETALEELKSEFAGWAADDVKKLEAARERLRPGAGPEKPRRPDARGA